MNTDESCCPHSLEAPPAQSIDRRDLARFIVDMAEELSILARRGDWPIAAEYLRQAAQSIRD